MKQKSWFWQIDYGGKADADGEMSCVVKIMHVVGFPMIINWR